MASSLPSVAQQRADAADLQARLDARRRERVAWPSGPGGRAVTRRLLDQLAPEGFAVLHSVWWPGEAIEVDHLAVGPTGVWLVAAQDFAYPLSVGRRGTLWTGCHPLHDLVAEARSAAARVTRALAPALEESAAAVPVLAAHKALVPDRALVDDGVHVVDATRGLLPLLCGGGPVLDDDQVARVAQMAEAASRAW